MPQIIDFSESFSPVYGNLIMIPANSFFYRGYSTKFEPVSERPAYYSTKLIAHSYTKRNNATGVLSVFTNIRPLRLLDYRFLRVILKQLIQDIRDTHALTENDKRVFITTMISFGLTSFLHQMKLLRENTNPQYLSAYQGFDTLFELEKKVDNSFVEKEGIRIGEGNIDAMTMAFLKGIFKDKFDGFVSPAIYSPFHIEKTGNILPQEMIIFNPKVSGIKLFDPSTLDPRIQIPIVSIDNITNRFSHVTIEYKHVKTTFLMSGGSIKKNKKYQEHPLNKIEDALNSSNPNISNAYDIGYNTGSKFSFVKPFIMHSIAPSPYIDVPIFS